MTYGISEFKINILRGISDNLSFTIIFQVLTLTIYFALPLYMLFPDVVKSISFLFPFAVEVLVAPIPAVVIVVYYMPTKEVPDGDISSASISS